MDQLKSCRAGCSRSPCTNFDNNNSGASGEIRTLKHLFLRQAAIPIRTRWHLVYGEDLNLRVPLGETGLQFVANLISSARECYDHQPEKEI